ncbi:hypothetical protein [Ligilactobacillus apodemi]|nr:hypothetical protein [Ligilactobacillus apodemi]
MAIETWDNLNIVIWLCFGILLTVLTYGVRGYNGKVRKLGAAGYTMFVGALSILNGATLGQYMYDEKVKYDVWGSLGTALGLSVPLLVSVLILLIFYRYRVVKHPEEVVVKGKDLIVSRSYLLSGLSTFLWGGLLLGGVGIAYVVMALVGDREGFLIASTVLIPIAVSFWLIAKYRKWIFKYIVWVLRRKGLLQVEDEKSSSEKEI